MKRIDAAELIMDGAKELMQNKTIEDVSVKDICKTCKVSRQTFYKYFTDKYDVVSRIYSKTITKVLDTADYSKPIYISIGRMMEVMIKDRRFYENALKYRGQNSLEDQMYEHVLAGYIQIISRYPEALMNEDLQFEIRFTAHAGTGCMIDWIKGGMKEDPYEVGKSIAACIPAKMSTYLDDK